MLETTCAQFAAAERPVGELRGAEMEVARSKVKGTGEENIAAVKGDLKQSVGCKNTQCYKFLGYGCTQRIRCNNCRKEDHKAADCFNQTATGVEEEGKEEEVREEDIEGVKEGEEVKMYMG